MVRARDGGSWEWWELGVVRARGGGSWGWYKLGVVRAGGGGSWDKEERRSKLRRYAI